MIRKVGKEEGGRLKTEVGGQMSEGRIWERNQDRGNRNEERGKRIEEIEMRKEKTGKRR